MGIASGFSFTSGSTSNTSSKMRRAAACAWFETLRDRIRAELILIEREAEYVADIRRRIAHVSGLNSPLFGAAA